MTASNYAACYALTRQYEGGDDDDPRDPGGRTSRGVTQDRYDIYRRDKGLPKADVWRASEDEIADIYRIYYWNAVVGDQWPEGPDLVVWDCGVNSGPARAKQFADGVLGKQPLWGALAATCRAQTDKTVFVKAFCAKRLAFLEGLKTFKTFGKGWSRRVASVEANGVKMALVAANAAPADIKKKLQTEGAQAQTKASASKKAAGGAGVGGAAGGTHATTQQFDWNTALEVGAVILLVLAAIYFIHWMRAHKERANAYAAVAATV